MNASAQMRLSGTIALLMLALLGAVLYLALVFPRTLAVWADEGRALSVAEQLIAQSSMFCRSFGLVLTVVLLAGLVGCGVWAAIAGRRDR